MDERDTSYIKRSHIIAALAVFSFGWGSLWAANEAVHLTIGKPAIDREVAAVAASSPAISGTAIPRPNVATTTAPSKPAEELKIVIGGDVMLDRSVRKVGQKNGYDSLFGSIAPLFQSADIGVVNLEGPVTSYASKTLLANALTTTAMSFTFSPETVPALLRAGITMVGLANNHTDNFGVSGWKETKKRLDDAGEIWFGDPWNTASTSRIIAKNGISVAFVGYHAFQSGFDRILADVRRLKDDGDFVIVMPHWGVEYSTTTTALQEKQARQLAEAGADAIVGSHPHVVLPNRWIGDVPVFYSLGNLVFDQYFSPGVMRGEIVELDLKKSGGETKLDHVKTHEVSIGKNGPILDGDSVEVSHGE